MECQIGCYEKYFLPRKVNIHNRTITLFKMILGWSRGWLRADGWGIPILSVDPKQRDEAKQWNEIFNRVRNFSKPPKNTTISFMQHLSRDKDQDGWLAGNCAKSYGGGGWW